MFLNWKVDGMSYSSKVFEEIQVGLREKSLSMSPVYESAKVAGDVVHAVAENVSEVGVPDFDSGLRGFWEGSGSGSIISGMVGQRRSPVVIVSDGSMVDMLQGGDVDFVLNLGASFVLKGVWLPSCGGKGF